MLIQPRSVCVLLQTAGRLKERYKDGTCWHCDRHITVGTVSSRMFVSIRKRCLLSIWHQSHCFYWEVKPVEKQFYKACSAPQQLLLRKETLRILCNSKALAWSPRHRVSEVPKQSQWAWWSLTINKTFTRLKLVDFFNCKYGLLLMDLAQIEFKYLFRRTFLITTNIMKWCLFKISRLQRDQHCISVRVLTWLILWNS